MHFSRLLILVAAIAGIVAVHLPWSQVSLLGEIQAVAINAIVKVILLVLFVVILITAISGKRLLPLISPGRWMVALAGFIILWYAGYEFYSVSFSFSSPANLNGLAMKSSAGAGLYLTIVSTVVAIATVLIIRRK